MSLPSCPKCGCEYTYENGHMIVCPECANEWSVHQDELDAVSEKAEMEASAVRDVNGNILDNDDNAVVVNDIRITGSSEVIKRGTRVQNIQLEENGAHNIVAKVDGFGIMELKSELIRKA